MQKVAGLGAKFQDERNFKQGIELKSKQTNALQRNSKTSTCPTRGRNLNPMPNAFPSQNPTEHRAHMESSQPIGG